MRCRWTLLMLVWGGAMPLSLLVGEAAIAQSLITAPITTAIPTAIPDPEEDIAAEPPAVLDGQADGEISPEPLPELSPDGLPAADGQPGAEENVADEPEAIAQDDEAVATPETPLPPAEQADEASSPKPEPEIDPSPSAITEAAAEARLQLLIEADRLHQQGQLFAAEQLYRKAKGVFTGVEVANRPAPIWDAEQLAPAGRVYWREVQAGLEANLETRVTVPLELLVGQYPEFLPGQIQYAQWLLLQDQPQAALASLEAAATLYPDQAHLIEVRVEALANNEQWLEAAIAARQFALLYPNDPAADDFRTLSTTHQERFESRVRSRLRSNAIANVLTGVAGYALTGSLYGPFSALETTIVMLRGESAVGRQIANQARNQLELIEDEAVISYVNELGQELASLSGRDEFDYQFYVVRRPELNAFALPGGKIFINAGAIMQTNSEAELAGLIAHELAHAVLSHGFQMVTRGNLTANLLQFIPYGNIAANLAILNYSRDMERQADALGTQMLAQSGYAADGLYNLMVTLGEQSNSPRPLFPWLSTHPDTGERVRNMERQIELNGYNRYTFEGVERHREIQQRVSQLMDNPDEKLAEDRPDGEPATSNR